MNVFNGIVINLWCFLSLLLFNKSLYGAFSLALWIIFVIHALGTGFGVHAAALDRGHNFCHTVLTETRNVDDDDDAY